jgi:ribosome-binding factor A
MSIKQDRMAERIQSILSELLLREVADPRLQGVTVTEVQLDAELTFAKIYVNALGDEGRKDEVLAGLQRATGFLRREVGKHVHLRLTPELHFEWDATLEHGERLNQIISSLDIPPEEQIDDNEHNSME